MNWVHLVVRSFSVPPGIPEKLVLQKSTLLKMWFLFKYISVKLAFQGRLAAQKNFLQLNVPSSCSDQKFNISIK
jgi:hypothetical protein